jgi:hypothetical protein
MWADIADNVASIVRSPYDLQPTTSSMPKSPRYIKEGKDPVQAMKDAEAAALAAIEGATPYPTLHSTGEAVTSLSRAISSLLFLNNTRGAHGFYGFLRRRSALHKIAARAAKRQYAMHGRTSLSARFYLLYAVFGLFPLMYGIWLSVSPMGWYITNAMGGHFQLCQAVYCR